MKKKIWISALLIISIVVMVIFLFVVNGDKQPKQSIEKEYINIKSSQKIYINGTVSSLDVSNIYLDADCSNVVETYVTNKSHVDKDQILFKCKNNTITSQIEEYNDQISGYNSEISNNSNSLNKLNEKINKAKEEISKLNNNSEIDSLDKETKMDGYNSEIQGYEDQIDTLNSQISTTQQSIKSINDKVSKLSSEEYKEIKAAVSGTVYLKDNGVDATMPYMVIYGNELVVNGQIDEKSKEKLSVNQKVSIKIIANNKEVEGRINSINDLPSQSSQDVQVNNSLSNYEVIVSIDNQDCVSYGYHVQCVAKEEHEKVEIPKEAIVTKKNNSYVYKDVDGQVKKCAITYEDSDNSNYVYVLSGISEEDKIIKNVNEYLEGRND